MEEYLEDRVEAQRKWYELKANKNKSEFFSNQTIIIILGALIPVLIAFESVSTTLKDYGGPITAIISAVIAVIAGLDKLKQPQLNWFNYRANEEAIKKEEWFHKYRAGPYRGLPDKEAEKVFIERIESIIASDIARITSIVDKVEETDSKNSNPGNESTLMSPPKPVGKHE